MPSALGRTLLMLGWSAVLATFALSAGSDFFSGARPETYAVTVFFFLLIPVVRSLLGATIDDAREKAAAGGVPKNGFWSRMRYVAIFLSIVAAIRSPILPAYAEAVGIAGAAILLFRIDSRVAFILSGALLASYPFVQASPATTVFSSGVVFAAESFVAVGLLAETLARVKVRSLDRESPTRTFHSEA